MILRHYQQAACDAVLSDIAKGGRSGLIVHATGTGKSVTMSEVITRFTDRYRLPVLVIVHRKRLVDQLSATLRERGLTVAIEMAEQQSHAIDAQVTVASVPSLARESRRKRYHAERFGLVAVDESHRSSSDGHLKILNHFPNAYRLGFTATPDRADQKELPFDKVLHEYRLTTAIKEGHLCPIQAELLPIRINATKVKIQAGDFKESDIDEALIPYLNKIADEIASRKEKHLVFLPLRKTSRYMTELLNERGLKTIHLDGETEDVDGAIKAYEAGEYDCICNAMLLNEGVDIPCVSCITNLRITKSRGTYSQIIGRGTRNHHSKSRLLILDCLWHTKRHQICRPASLVAGSAAIEEQIEAKYRGSGKISLLAALEAAEEEVAVHGSSLVREIRQHEHKQRELIDPLTMEQYKVDGYKQQYDWQKLPPTEAQLVWVKKQGINPNGLTRGLAHYLFEKVRDSAHATPAQERMLRGAGKWKDGMTKNEASKLVDIVIGTYKNKGRRR